MSATSPILFIDNADSFVYNLVDACEGAGQRVDVFRSDWPAEQALGYLKSTRPRLLVLSPGPCGPREATLCMELLAAAPGELPIFGVCLGLQCIVEHFGGRVQPTGKPAHGRASLVRHDGDPLFAGVENPFLAGRYHSLAAAVVPDSLRVIARMDDMVMAVRHVARPIWGVQFHPESILTPVGHRLIENVLASLECLSRDA